MTIVKCTVQIHTKIEVLFQSFSFGISLSLGNVFLRDIYQNVVCNHSGQLNVVPICSRGAALVQRLNPSTVGLIWNCFHLVRDLLSQARGELFHPHPELWALWVWPERKEELLLSSLVWPIQD